MTRPSTFFYRTIGGLPMTYIDYRIELDEHSGVLDVTEQRDGGSVRCLDQHAPLDAAWGHLRSIFMDLDAVRWEHTYKEGVLVMDGAPYELLVEWPDLRVRVEGNERGPAGWPVAQAALHALASGDDERLAQLAPLATPLGTIEAAMGYAWDADQPDMRDAIDLAASGAAYLALGGDDLDQLDGFDDLPYALEKIRVGLTQDNRAAFDEALDALIAAAPERAVEMGLAAYPI